MGEWSGVSNLTSSDNAADLVKSQLKVYGWSAGSMFYNFKLNTSKLELLTPRAGVAKLWSLFDLVDMGVFPKRDTSKTVKEFTNSLSSACGSDPENSWN